MLTYWGIEHVLLWMAEMSEQVETVDEPTPSSIAENTGRPGFMYHYRPMVGDVLRVTAIVGGFGAALLTVHNGIELSADLSRDFEGTIGSLLSVFD
jgi:hypothetical protein